MKRVLLFLLFILLFISPHTFCQSEFMIGTEWINNPARPGDLPHVPSSTDWANIIDLGLKWGGAE